MPRTTTVDLLDLTESFNAWCAQRQVSRSFAMRQLVAAAIRSDSQLSLLALPDITHIASDWIATDRDQENRSYRLTLRLTQEQRNHLRICAKAAGVPCSRYILAAITARDSHVPLIAGNDAVRALVDSNDLLAKTAMKLSSWQRRAASSDAELVRELKVVMREHMARAAAIISQVEVTRIGRVAKDKAERKTVDAKPGGNRSGGRALG